MAKVRWSANMTAEEQAALEAEIERMDRAYGDQPPDSPPPVEWEDAMETLRRAALDHRGRP